MLYVCPTPIGNLDDITLRVIRVLRAVDLIVCEDTRRTAKLLSRFEIEQPLLSFFEHNEIRRIPQIMQRLEAGIPVALVSDAGMPGVSDPGYTLVREVVDRGLPLSVLPGPSAIGVALVSSGLPTDSYNFTGYLPRRAKEVVEVLETAGCSGATVVAFESPRRLVDTLETIFARWPERRLAVCRELTKVHEEILRGTAAGVLATVERPVRGEIVVVLEPVEPATGVTVAPREIDIALESLLERGFGVKEAARLLAGVTGMSTRVLYDRALSVRKT